MINLFNDPSIQKTLGQIPKSLTLEEMLSLRTLLVRKSIEAVHRRIEQLDMRQIPPHQRAEILVAAETQIENTLSITKVDQKNKYVEASIEDGKGNTQKLQFPFIIAFPRNSEESEDSEEKL